MDGIADAVVVGGGPAGLNAALVLGRTRRHVFVVHSGEPRNAASHHMNGFLSRDGLDPGELRRIGREQLRPYPSVEAVADRVEAIVPTGVGFEVSLVRHPRIKTRKVLLAVGVSDVLPTVPGFDGLHGNSAFHCQYCDGWESRDQHVAVLTSGAGGFRLAMLLLSWTRDVVLCSNGVSQLGSVERELLARQSIAMDESPVARLESTGGQLQRIVFEDGHSIERNILFFDGPVPLNSELPGQLGCALTDAGRIEVDEAGRTSVEGVYAAGDAARRRGQHPSTQVIFAAASGALAAIAIHQDLMYEDVGIPPALPPAPRPPA